MRPPKQVGLARPALGQAYFAACGQMELVSGESEQRLLGVRGRLGAEIRSGLCPDFSRCRHIEKRSSITHAFSRVERFPRSVGEPWLNSGLTPQRRIGVTHCHWAALPGWLFCRRRLSRMRIVGKGGSSIGYGRRVAGPERTARNGSSKKLFEVLLRPGFRPLPLTCSGSA